jgi:hypothetical protein
MTSSAKQNLWLRWTSANAIGEMLGLGATFGEIALVFTRLADK